MTMRPYKSIAILAAVLAALVLISGFVAGMVIASAKAREKYEMYLVSQNRMVQEFINRQADELDRQAVIIDSLGVECMVNRACWVRMQENTEKK